MTTYAGPASGATAVNLSRLPFPAVIEVLSFEAIVAAAKASLVELMPDLAPTLELESEPLVKLIEVFAYREMMMRQRVNDAGKAVTVAYAIGSDLDHLGALFGVWRLTLSPAVPELYVEAVMESDDALRARILLAPEGYSVAGPEGAYKFHALSASGDVLDASAISVTPGQVIVTVLSRLAGGVPGAPLLALVTAAVSAEDRRPLTDQVIVQAAAITNFTVVATLKTFAGPDASVVLAEARARLDAHLAESFRLGRDVTRSAIIAALSAEGVQDVTLTTPAANIVCTRLQAARCTAITITDGGIAE